MPVLCIDGIAWTFKLLPVKTQRPAFGMLGHSSLYFRDQYVVSWDNKG